MTGPSGSTRRPVERPALPSLLRWQGLGAVFFSVLLIAVSRIDATPSTLEGGLRATLIDQLSPAYANDEFTEVAIASLTAHGLDVDRHEGDAVDVELYRSLGERHPAVVIIRSHSGILRVEGGDLQGVTALFTNEPYSSGRYVADQLWERLLIVRPFETDPKLTFGITPAFIRQSMDGYLPRTIVVVAGCSVLGRTDLAEALVSRGAAVVISFDSSVSLSYADKATARLLQHIFVERDAVEEAVVAIMAEVGPDPEYGAVLRYFPASAGDLTAADLLRARA